MKRQVPHGVHETAPLHLLLSQIQMGQVLSKIRLDPVAIAEAITQSRNAHPGASE